MANVVSTTGTTSLEKRRWSTISICLNKILAPNLKNAIAAEFQDWHNLLTKPPTEIDKQVFKKHLKTLPPSKFPLKYENINDNNVHISPSTYDYAVNDPLSLAKVFLQPYMAKFTAFDETMDFYAVLTIMLEAEPFVRCGTAIHAKNVREAVWSNMWSVDDFSMWTDAKFNETIKEMQSLVETTNLSDTVKKEVCDELQHCKYKGISLNYYKQ